MRCTAVALALHSIGFENVYAMKGALGAFIKHVDAKTAFLPSEQGKANPAGTKQG